MSKTETPAQERLPHLTLEEMWSAVAANDATYDGLFFYGVGTTGIFCRPSCKSRRPKPENVRYFDSADAARAAGYRPCKRCRSDLPAYSPMLELARKLRALLDATYAEPRAFAQGLKPLGISARRAGELFRAEYGTTPGEYTAFLRLKLARRLLAETRDPLVDVALATGFAGLSGFYRFFTAREGITPAAYRRLHRRDAAPPAVNAPRV